MNSQPNTSIKQLLLATGFCALTACGGGGGGGSDNGIGGNSVDIPPGAVRITEQGIEFTSGVWARSRLSDYDMNHNGTRIKGNSGEVKVSIEEYGQTSESYTACKGLKETTTIYEETEDDYDDWEDDDSYSEEQLSVELYKISADHYLWISSSSSESSTFHVKKLSDTLQFDQGTASVSGDSIDITENQGVCAEYKHRNSEQIRGEETYKDHYYQYIIALPYQTTKIALTITRDDQPLQAGTYRIPEDISFDAETIVANYYHPDLLGNGIDSGVLTIDTVSDSQIKGSFTINDQFGESIDGSFDVAFPTF